MCRNLALSFFLVVGMFQVVYGNNKGFFVDKKVIDFPVIRDNNAGVFQLVSHGRPGELLIEGKWRDASEIASYLKLNHFVDASMSHVNIYGCEFAKGEKGRVAVRNLERMLHVSIAASSDITGKGGNWILESGNPVAAFNFPDYDQSLQCNSSTFSLTSAMMGGTSTHAGISNVIKGSDFPKTMYNVNGIQGLDITISVTGSFTTSDDGTDISPMLINGRFTNYIDPDLITSTANNWNRYKFSFTGTVKPTGVTVSSLGNNLFSSINGPLKLNEQLKATITRANLTGTVTASGTQQYGCSTGFNDPISITSGLGTSPFVNFVMPLSFTPSIVHKSSCGLTGSLSDNKGIATLTVEYSNPSFVTDHIPNTDKANLQRFNIDLTVCLLSLPLEIEEIRLKAKASESGNILNWESGSDDKNAYFTMEKSLNGSMFRTIGNPVPVTDNGILNPSYSGIDHELSNISRVYYRIALHTSNGEVNYSKIVVMDQILDARPTVVLFPNPLHDKFQVKLQNEGQYDLTICDLKGSVMEHHDIQATTSDFLVDLNRDKLADGIYILKVINKETKERTAKKLIVK